MFMRLINTVSFTIYCHIFAGKKQKRSDAIEDIEDWSDRVYDRWVFALFYIFCATAQAICLPDIVHLQKSNKFAIQITE